MGKITTTKINRWDGGVSGDIREQIPNKFARSQHFDILTNPKRLTPYRSTITDEVSKTPGIVRFVEGNSQFWGMGDGEAGATGKAKVYYKNGTDPTITDWTVFSSQSTSAQKDESFGFYKDFLYWFAGSTLLQRLDTNGGGTPVTAYQTLTSFSTVAEPVLHPADNIMYMFTDNIVHTLNNTTWTEGALTLPDNLKITSATAYGDFLAIGCSPKNTGEENSIVYLWDRDSSLSTISQKIDFGKSDLRHIAVLDGLLIGIMDRYLTASTSIFDPSFQVRVASGSGSILLHDIISDTIPTSLNLNSNKFIEDNKLYFTASHKKDGILSEGIWVLTKNSLGEFIITLDYIEEDVSGTNPFQGIYKYRGYWWIAHSADGSVNQTDTTANYTFTSIYESLVFGKPEMTNDLLSATITTLALPTAGQVVLKYLKDEDIDGQDWAGTSTTIFTNTTDNSIRHTAVNDSTGTTLPKYKEIQFRIESTGGAEITGLVFRSEEFKDDII